MHYADFDVSLEAVENRTYRIAVLHSPAGEAQEIVAFPLDTVALRLGLTQLENALLKSSGQRRAPTKEEQAVQDFGRTLFGFLMHGEIGHRYDVSHTLCRQAGQGLRLKLRLNDPMLAALPWEFLYDGRFNEYLALSQHTPLVRYLPLPRPQRALSVTPPLRLLGMVANPAHPRLPQLNVAVEKQRMEQALAGLRAAGLVELTWLPGESWRDLQRALRRETWHILHFIGHGGFDRLHDEGYLVFTDEQGQAEEIRATDLTRLLDHDALRLVLLNSCDGAHSGDDVFSSTAAALVRSGRPCVIAMQYTITDAAAIEFSRTFYEALAEGLPTEIIVGDARKSITFSRQGSLEWGTPVVFTHAPDGVLFTLTPTPAAPPPPQAKPASHPRPPWPLNPRGLPLIESWEQLRAVENLPPRLVWVKDQKEMALIPAGPFLMGTPETEARKLTDWLKLEFLLAETPQHRVTLPHYYLDVTPVTHAEYARFIVENPAQAAPTGTHPLSLPHAWDGKSRQPPDAVQQHPVVLVDWQSAIAYAKWAGKALPTEEQWEKGARGDDGRIYPWGNTWDWRHCNSAERHYGRDFDKIQQWWDWWNPLKNAKETPGVFTTPVGSYPLGASPHGLLDMGGNVWEWCDAWYAAYPGSSAQHDDFGRKYRVVRGGAWSARRYNVRCASRDRNAPHKRNDDVGFRCASTPF